METIILALFAIGILLVILLICRELLIWYWKIDVIIKNQDRTNKILLKIVDILSQKEKEQTNK